MSRQVTLTLVIGIFSVCLSCNSRQDAKDIRVRPTLRDYAQKASRAGSREALIGYAADEEEDMLFIPNLQQVMNQHEWVVGSPVEEESVTYSTSSKSSESDSTFTVYRLRVLKPLGRSTHTRAADRLERTALKELPPLSGQILVLKRGGNAIVDGVLLKKRHSSCLSELLPRLYLLALTMDDSDRVGRLDMGCQAIFMIDGDRLTPLSQDTNPVPMGMKNGFSNSLSLFGMAFEKHDR